MLDEIDLNAFENILTSVRKLFQIIPLENAVSALRAGNLPARAACITFDDGYPDWITSVLPALEKHKLHATFFVTSGQFFGMPMWNERILHAVANAPIALEWLELPGVDLPRLALKSETDKQQSVLSLDQFLKYQEPKVRERTLLELERLTNVDIGRVPTMSIADLQVIHRKGFDIGSHTVTHPILARCTPELALQEMILAREQLESIIQDKVTAFAYPNGAPERDFGTAHIEMVKKAGYSYAVTTHRGAATSATSVFQIPRFTPWGPSATKMELQLARNLMQSPRLLPEAESDQEQKRALMIAYHFPPQAGSSGILRTLNFVKHLPQYQWHPTVLTANARVYAEQSNDLVATIPARTRVLRAFALDASRHFAVGGKYLRTLALPDRWSTWWFGAVILGLREIRRQRPDIIWSTYPIATAHLIGGTLAGLTGIPWVADFRDPMVSSDYPSDKLQRKIWTRLEAYFLKKASACVFTTHRAAATYRQRYPLAANKCHVIENGYDEEAFTGVQSSRFGTPSDTLLLLHSGLIYPQDRNPSTLFEAIKTLIDEDKLERNRLCIRFRAPHHGEEVKAFAAAYGLEDIVDIAPPVPYQQAIAEMMGADLLLVFQGSNFNAQIPAKIYEYLRAQRPILAVLDPSGDTAVQLQQFDGIYFGDIASAAHVQGALIDWLDASDSTKPAPRQDANLGLVRQYSRISQAALLSKVLQTHAASSVP
ncbi:polysaccharide deacetylase family protein [Rhodoferax sp.]|uniref:polysaccharide deacetylase family protein n=1 Tax=Rhodoferax sp. TaxID=50421 RepID=UPI00283B9BD2|nr:polysaccharide deacetylase family protein [Rhodoferax sp.]MDR3368501.1 polysaccharide deacetylase family protein [Rhodoferax sp.]